MVSIESISLRQLTLARRACGSLSVTSHRLARTTFIGRVVRMAFADLVATHEALLAEVDAGTVFAAERRDAEGRLIEAWIGARL